jgi:hypothetical protein
MADSVSSSEWQTCPREPSAGYRAQIPAQIRRLIQHHRIRSSQRRGKAVLEHAHFHGIGARLQHRDDRLSPTRARNPASVVAIAVGWWAKSS